MRIIGDIPNPHCKITIFKTTSRFSVKFEQGVFEQTYKFRVGETINDLRDVKAVVNEAFINQVIAQFNPMAAIKQQALKNYIDDAMSEFDEIF